MPESVEEVIRAAAAQAVGENLDWNVRAYGKAWTGEGEDTDFIVGDVPKAIVNALYDHGYYIAARETEPAPEPDTPDFVGDPLGTHAADDEPLGSCPLHGDYWTDDCLRCGR
jgi:hypothetical protein